MALDATGTPTSILGIPKYNTAVDPPSGKGFNAAMDYIDSIINAHTGVNSAGTTILGNKLLTADAQPAFVIRGDGDHEWGAGGASAFDVTLYRDAANVLATDDQFWIKGAAGLKFPDGTTMITAAASGVNSPASIASGEVPVYNGSTYVRSTVTRIGATSLGSGSPSSANFLRGDGTWATATPAALVPATTLPGSPTNGQQAILTDSTTAPTYQWLFQYDTTISDANKWAFLGGAPATSEVATSESRNSTSYGDTATVHSLTLPRAGIYEFYYGLRGEVDTSENNAQALSPKYSAAEAIDADAIAVSNMNSAAGPTLIMTSRSKRFTVAAANQVVTMRYKQGTASASSPVSDRWLKVTPVRVA
jgi:hypothetical protein